MEEYAARMGEIINAYEVLVGKPEKKGRLVRPRRRLSIILKWILEKGCVLD